MIAINNDVRDIQRRPVTCLLCGSAGLFTSYHTDSVIYVVRGYSPSMWPVELMTSENVLDDLPDRLKRGQRLDLDWTAGGVPCAEGHR